MQLHINTVNQLGIYSVSSDVVPVRCWLVPQMRPLAPPRWIWSPRQLCRETSACRHIGLPGFEQAGHTYRGKDVVRMAYV